MEEHSEEQQQLEFWNGPAGARWVRMQDGMDIGIAAHSRAALDRAEPGTGEVVWDIGCGCGTTSLALAHAVGLEGQVTGLDISAPMLARAQQRGLDAALPQLAFLQADAAGYAFPPAAADLIFSRFGLMFFADPVAAFRNIAASLKPGGRLVFVCWQARRLNPWMMVPAKAAGRFLDLPPRTPPGRPGPFGLSEEGLIAEILEAAGFKAVAIDALAYEMNLGGAKDIESAVAFAVEIGPLALPYAQAAQDTQQQARVAIAEALTPYFRSDGVWFPSASWLVSARV